MERLAGQVILRHLALELDAVGAVSGHRLSSFESPAPRSIPYRHTVRLKGRTPINCQTFSCGLSSGHLADRGISVMFRGTFRRLDGAITLIGPGTWFVRSILAVMPRRSHPATLALPPP